MKRRVDCAQSSFENRVNKHLDWKGRKGNWLSCVPTEPTIYQTFFSSFHHCFLEKILRKIYLLSSNVSLVFSLAVWRRRVSIASPPVSPWKQKPKEIETPEIFETSKTRLPLQRRIHQKYRASFRFFEIRWERCLNAREKFYERPPFSERDQRLSTGTTYITTFRVLPFSRPKYSITTLPLSKARARAYDTSLPSPPLFLEKNSFTPSDARNVSIVPRKKHRHEPRLLHYFRNVYAPASVYTSYTLVCIEVSCGK